MDAITISPPEQGQLVDVRHRRYVVADVVRSALPASSLDVAAKPQHLVTLVSVEDDALGEELQVVWELEPGARVHEKIAFVPSNRPSGAASRSYGTIKAISFGQGVGRGGCSPADGVERGNEPVDDGPRKPYRRVSWFLR